MGTFKVLLITAALMTLSLAVIRKRDINRVLNTLPPSIVLRSVQNSSTPICNGFWAKSGYVCSPKRTIAFNEHDQKKFSDQTKVFFTIVDQIGAISVKGEKYFKNLNYQIKKNLQIYADPKLSGDMKEEAHKCWNHMKQYRSTSLCFACSAVNYQYYRNRLGLISMDSCNEMIKSCIHHFNTVVHLHHVVKYIHAVAQELKKSKVFKNLSIASLESLIKSTRSKDQDRFGEILTERLKALFKKGGSKDKIDQYHKEICEKTITLRQQPIILNYFGFVSKPIKMVHDAIVSSGKVASILTSRSLTSFDDWGWHDSLGDLVTSEISIFNDWTVSGKLNEQPMNMSLVFP